MYMNFIMLVYRKIQSNAQLYNRTIRNPELMAYGLLYWTSVYTFDLRVLSTPYAVLTVHIAHVLQSLVVLVPYLPTVVVKPPSQDLA